MGVRTAARSLVSALPVNLSVQPNDRVPFQEIYSDHCLLVVNKPAGVATQPGKGRQHDTLLNGLFARHGAALQNVGAQRDWGLVHRLDKGTSGLLVVALKPWAHDRLREAFEQRAVEKRYLALVWGSPREPAGVIRLSLAESTDPRSGKKISVVSRDGKPAVTAYRVISSRSRASLIECRIGTGRLHQIRAHLASLGHPVLGDEIYAQGDAREGAPRVMLHATYLGFAHPESGQNLEFRAEIPADMSAGLRRLRLATGPSTES